MDNCSAFIATRAPTLTIALMKRIVPLLFCTIAASASAQSFQFNGFISAREIYVKAQPSWTQGGFGRFDVGAANADDHRYVNIDVAQLGLDWSPATWRD